MNEDMTNANSCGGATGNLGSEVMRLLHTQGHQFRVAVRNPSETNRNLPSGVEPLEGWLVLIHSL